MAYNLINTKKLAITSLVSIRLSRFAHPRKPHQSNPILLSICWLGPEFSDLRTSLINLVIDSRYSLSLPNNFKAMARNTFWYLLVTNLRYDPNSFS